MVFTAPNRATTTSGSSNTRSELRQMLRGTSTRIGTPKASVDQVAVKAQCPDRNPAYSVVVGQIHAVGYDDTSSGFGYGNEPIKIYYKKFPGQDTGSVFWTYERNLARDNPDRSDIAVPGWRNIWDNVEDPGENGISLGE